ncbi:ankyrin repeat and SOCS box protein 1-like isoform X1 [Amphibalanus amphitrite]|uniref:ankyrin repeat and SOCS box protein 1-like isoform X1 n=1 Tax=Amphibalanus amphitrite TaxID=1232801 RepID=UPI001C8FF6E9|nr:ankyrin repeat and SOCS box protein 1-like isoform X1 [Amphibalanus amphitrite]XP_043240349.1 ankyrin repeat and SOCS box protein 1-like isoform X1 [Amphibalanus amphitrite]XP_043240350.1 ankyrin repeat and SOCS box protein 1-like isoform X1 [Amphibalanus amphitrite]XP_043240351.1 ankyrin repeat and SOCS box protein 1-like isoform X1 [Amphibalanus amphitrite]XP_043240352.1 ankyrin repeat and SOCS box protein 1-like isoform X1 [Amphibalanus amphitrite]XP_043240353.1 ankyrin repeat and SOCS b
MDLSSLLLDEDEPAEDIGLHQAAYAGDAAELRRLLQLPHYRSAINRRLRLLGVTPLRLAVSGDSLECVCCLLEHGAEVDLTDMKGQTPLFVAVKDQHLECARLLLRRGASPDGSADNLSTPLGQCCQSGWLPGVQLLLAVGADPERGLLRGGPVPALPLHTAAVYHHLDCFLALLLAGSQADPARRPRVPADAVSRVSLPHALLRHRCSVEFIELLYEFGGNLWQLNSRGLLAWEAEPDSLLVKPLKQLAGTPHSLQNLCRLRVRRWLGRRRLPLLARLPLPPAVISYLIYSDTIRLVKFGTFRFS